MPTGGAGVTASLAEHRHEQIGTPVDDFGMLRELRHAVDHAQHLQHLDLAEIAGSRLWRQQADRDRPAGRAS